MTVLPRPLPTRFSGNRGPGGLGRGPGRGGGPGGGGNSPPGRIPPTGRPVWTPAPALPVPAVAAVARIPLPVQALALIAAFAVGYAIGLALVQLWGRLAGPPRSASNEATFLDTGTFTELGKYTRSVTIHDTVRGETCYGSVSTDDYTKTELVDQTVEGPNVSVRNLRIVCKTVTEVNRCRESGETTNQQVGERLWAYEQSYNIGTSNTVTSGRSTGVWSGPNIVSVRGTFTRRVVLNNVKRNGVIVWEPNQPETPTPIAPVFNETPAVAAAPQLLPVLPVRPIAPAADPVPVPSEPATAPRPAPVRVAPRPALPLPVPDARQTNSGQLLPLPQAAPATIPADVHFPWPGGPAVGPGGTRPDAVAIAQEVGRIEQKLALMPKPGPDPSNPVDWGDLASTLLRIWEAIQSVNAAGVYTLSSPCELDEDTEERIVTEVPYDGALSWLEVLNNKVDALAQLQQVAKDLKQPICRHKAQGQPVTVTFIEE